jgi:hypothetical protein
MKKIELGENIGVGWNYYLNITSKHNDFLIQKVLGADLL